VTGKADSKCLREARKIKRDFPGTDIVFSGCLAMMSHDIKKLESMDEISIIVPRNKKGLIPSILGGLTGISTPDSGEQKAIIHGLAGHSRAFVKIQDGCIRKCSYCKVRLVRSELSFKTSGEVMREIKGLISAGFREIVLTGICLGSWKSEKGEDLPQLLDLISSLKSDHRLRLSSIEPDQITEDLVAKIRNSSKLCSHLHIPLQSGSDKILGLMRRPYSTERFISMILAVREAVPDIGISMDVIAGFPGETHEDFMSTVSLLRKVRPSRLHVFKYSDRRGTDSFTFHPKVPSKIAGDRVKELIALGQDLQEEFAQKFIQKKVRILLEKKDADGRFSGYTDEYVKVMLPRACGKQGQLINAVAEGFDRTTMSLIIKDFC
jgi:threonylcarbamoyladenosine tRNA methylthiotransferase MtaB